MPGGCGANKGRLQPIGHNAFQSRFGSLLASTVWAPGRPCWRQLGAPAVKRPQRSGVESDPRTSPGDSSPIPSVANLGFMRPPLVYLASILLGLLLHIALPVPLVSHAVAALVAAGTVVMAIGLFISAVRIFRAADTPVPGNRPTTTIVRTGPYRFSRNPIYLAFSLFQLGLSLWVGSLWLLITLVAAVALMSFVIIPREERYLEARFPTEYLPYKAAVRRWL